MLKIIYISLFFCFSFQNLFADEYFLTLRNDKVNLRQGPSFEYPIKLFYKKNFSFEEFKRIRERLGSSKTFKFNKNKNIKKE